MEENQNVNANPPKKKKGKAKKILIALIVVLVIAIGVVAVLGFTGKLDFNFTKKSKADAGIEKIGDVVSQTVTDFETEYIEAGLKPKIYENKDYLDLKNVELTSKMSCSINEFEIEDMSSDNEEILEMFKDILDKCELEMAIKSGEEKGSIKIGATIADEPVSVELAYDGEKVGIRSEELNEKWITVELQEVIDALKEEIDLDEDAIAELEEIIEKYVKLVEDVMLTDKEIEHFKSTYANILTDYILSLDIESEKDTIEVGDKEKKCTKTTITLDEEDIKNFLISVVEKVEDDSEGQEIVKEKINTVMDFFIENAEMFDSMGTYSTPNYDYDGYNYYDYYTNTYSIVDEMKDAKKMINELFAEENFEMLKDSIEEIDLEGLEITIESYSSLAEVYATDITFEVDGNGILISMLFDKDTTNVTVSMESSGMSMDMAEIILVNEKNYKSFEVRTAKDVESYMGAMSLKGDIEFAENKMIVTYSANLGEEGSFIIKNEMSVKTNTDTEYQVIAKNNVKIDFPDVMKIDITYNIESEIKTSNIDFASIDEYIDITDGLIEGEPDEQTITELKQYIIDAVPGVVNVLEAVKTFEIVEQEELEEDIDEAIDMLESLSMEDFETITEEMPVETNPVVDVAPDFGTGTVIY